MAPREHRARHEDDGDPGGHDPHVERGEGLDDPSGEPVPEQQARRPGPEDGDAEGHALHDPQAGAGQHVVRERVAGPSADEREHEEADEEQPRDPARATEPSAEEGRQQLHDERRGQHERGPVMGLPDQQAAGRLPREGHDGVERLGDLGPGERRVGAVVGHQGPGRDVDDRQQDPGDRQHEQAGGRDDAEEARPGEVDPAGRGGGTEPAQGRTGRAGRAGSSAGSG